MHANVYPNWLVNERWIFLIEDAPYWKSITVLSCKRWKDNTVGESSSHWKSNQETSSRKIGSKLMFKYIVTNNTQYQVVRKSLSKIIKQNLSRP